MNIFDKIRNLSLACAVVFSFLLFTACGQGVDDNPDDVRVFDPPAQVGLVDTGGTTFVTDDHLDRPLSALMDVSGGLAVFLANGAIYYLDNYDGGYLTQGSSGIDFGSFENIAGILSHPTFNITQAHTDALQALEDGHRVLTIVLDGWGLYMHDYFVEVQPFLASLNPVVAHTVFPPFTPVAMSSIFTGQLPNVHGVHDRATRMMSYTDIFQRANDMGKTTLRVQGGVGIVQTSTTPILISNQGDAFATDQAVLEATLSRIDDADLTFVHFNLIDAVAHTYGPYSPQNGQAMAAIDDMMRQLVEAWDGVVIITADHGQHYHGQPGRLGDHLWVSHEDILVPYIMTGGR